MEKNNEIEKLKKEIEELKKQLYIEKQKNQKLMWLIGLTNANGLMMEKQGAPEPRVYSQARNSANAASLEKKDSN
jgi:AmiR/NasT family two-component response regulator